MDGGHKWFSYGLKKMQEDSRLPKGLFDESDDDD